MLDGLLEVFRLHGYEGASLSRIAAATGLQRASLYHRFPGGKQEMAEAVLADADEHFATTILAPLEGTAAPATRIRRMAGALDAFYAGGHAACLLDTLTLGDATPGLREHVQRTYAFWRDALATVAREAGVPAAAARRRADDALVRIQGALVVARASGDPAPWRRVLTGLPDLLLGEG